MTPRLTIPFALGLAALSPAGALAETGVGPWVAADEAEVRLVSSVTAVGPGVDEVRLGLHLRISEGWRIYWRTPGAAGLPPGFDWSGSANLRAVSVAWPAPARFEAYGQQSYGYAGEVLFPLAASLQHPGEALWLALELTYLICRDVCMPGEASLSLALPAGTPAVTEAAAEIARHAARVPREAASAGVTISARREPGGIALLARSPQPFVGPDVFLEWPVAAGQRRPDLPRPALGLVDGGRAARFFLALEPPLLRPGAIVTVTLVDGDRAVTAAVTVADGAAEIGAAGR